MFQNTKDHIGNYAMEESSSWSITSFAKIVLRWYFLTWLSGKYNNINVSNIYL